MVAPGSTIKDCLELGEGQHDVHVGIEHRLV